MSTSPRYAELRDYLRVIRQHRIIIVGVTVVFAAVALVLSVRATPTYVAETSLSTQDVTRGFSLLGEQASPETSPERLSAVTAETIASPEVVNRVKAKLRTPLSAGALSAAISARVELSTNLVILQGSSDKAPFAAQLANAFAESAVEVATLDQRRQLRATLRSLTEQVKQARAALRRKQPGADIRLSVAIQRASQLQTVIESARPLQVEKVASTPGTPVSPRPVRNTVLGVIVGLVIGLILAFVRDALDRRLRTGPEVEEALGLTIVGRVGRSALGRAGLATPGDVELDPLDLESFNILRANLEFLDVDNPPKVVLVTSALPEEGKSSVAASVAAAGAGTGRRVLLLEADLRRPSLAARLGAEPTPGLTDYLSGDAEPADVLQALPVRHAGEAKVASNDDTGRRSLVVITAGTPHPRPTELLGSQRSQDLLRELREVYDLIVVDTSPILSVADTIELVPHVDGILLCVRSGQTTRDQARSAKAALDRLPERPTAVALTGLRSSDEDGYGSYAYAYAYATATGQAVPERR